MAAETGHLIDFDGWDLCAGPGGWDVAAQRLGLDMLGFEIDEAAILTREAVGHRTAMIECEVSKAHPRGVRGLSMTEVDPAAYFVKPTRRYAHGRGRGGIASPPCQGFSPAGKGQARADSERLLKELAEVRTLADVEELIESCQQWMSHPGTALVLEPLRWALATTPSWLAWEQVPQVLPIWEACAVVLRRLGYSVVTGNVQAEEYGVPQTRKRAVLLARSPWLTAELGPVALPTPTHSRYNPRNPAQVHPDLPRWISMAEALGSGMTERPSMTVTGGGAATGGAEPFGNAARQGMVRELDAGRWQFAGAGATAINTAGQRRRDMEEPAHTITGKGTAAWVPENAIPGEGPDDVTWVEDCQAPTMVANFAADVVAKRGYRKPGDPPRQKTPGSVRVTAREAAILQSFPADYDFKGTKGKVFQQIGNAIPPLLAEALLCAVLDLPFERRLAVTA